MDEARKNAFRRILYAAMLDFRSHHPTSPYDGFSLRPFRIWKSARRLNEIQLLADWLHNLAAFAAHDFEGFDESWFWREWDGLAQKFPRLEQHVSFMRSQFELDWNPATDKYENVRQWGTLP